MDVAIIGAGNVGRALSTSFVRAGHKVRITSAGADNARSVAADTGATSVETNSDAVAGADVVVLAVPTASLVTVVTELGRDLDGKIVVDVSNRPTPNLENGAAPATSIAEELQASVPNARVVKAFNTAFASRQAEPVVDGIRTDGFVAGDDAAAKATVLQLVESIGFRPIDAGPLAVARTLEGLAWLNIDLQLRNGWVWQTGWTLAGPTAAPASKAA